MSGILNIPSALNDARSVTPKGIPTTVEIKIPIRIAPLTFLAKRTPVITIPTRATTAPGV